MNWTHYPLLVQPQYDSHSWYAHTQEMCSMPLFLCFVLCVYHALTMIATWSLLFIYHVHVLCLNHGSYMVCPFQTQFWICDWPSSNMAVHSVSPVSFIVVSCYGTSVCSDHVLFGHPISYCCSVLVFYLFVVVSVCVVCCQMKYVYGHWFWF
jgi:hypothetical protein